jgi:hypothetical protein
VLYIVGGKERFVIVRQKITFTLTSIFAFVYGAAHWVIPLQASGTQYPAMAGLCKHRFMLIMIRS